MYYSVRYVYDGDEISDYASNITVKADTPEEALKVARKDLDYLYDYGDLRSPARSLSIDGKRDMTQDQYIQMRKAKGLPINEKREVSLRSAIKEAVSNGISEKDILKAAKEFDLSVAEVRVIAKYSSDKYDLGARCSDIAEERRDIYGDGYDPSDDDEDYDECDSPKKRESKISRHIKEAVKEPVETVKFKNGDQVPIRSKDYLKDKLASYSNENGLEHLGTVKYKGKTYDYYDSGFGNMHSSYRCLVLKESSSNKSIKEDKHNLPSYIHKGDIYKVDGGPKNDCDTLKIDDIYVNVWLRPGDCTIRGTWYDVNGNPVHEPLVLGAKQFIQDYLSNGELYLYKDARFSESSKEYLRTQIKKKFTEATTSDKISLMQDLYNDLDGEIKVIDDYSKRISAANELQMTGIVDTITHIRDEEKEHVKELQDLIAQYSPKPADENPDTPIGSEDQQDLSNVPPVSDELDSPVEPDTDTTFEDEDGITDSKKVKGNSVREALKKGEIFKNAGSNWEVLDSYGNYTLIHSDTRKFNPYVVAYRVESDGSWGQGHYFDSEKDARKFFNSKMKESKVSSMIRRALRESSTKTLSDLTDEYLDSLSSGSSFMDDRAEITLSDGSTYVHVGKGKWQKHSSNYHVLNDVISNSRLRQTIKYSDKDTVSIYDPKSMVEDIDKSEKAFTIEYKEGGETKYSTVKANSESEALSGFTKTTKDMGRMIQSPKVVEQSEDTDAKSKVGGTSV